MRKYKHFFNTMQYKAPKFFAPIIIIMCRHRRAHIEYLALPAYCDDDAQNMHYSKAWLNALLSFFFFFFYHILCFI